MRTNDTDYKFRAHSTFSWYTGLGAADVIPESVLVLEPTAAGHDAFLYIHPRSPKDTEEFFRDRRHGEFWVGRRLTSGETEKRYGVTVKHVSEVYSSLSDGTPTIAIRGEDPLVDAALPAADDRDIPHRPCHCRRPQAFRQAFVQDKIWTTQGFRGTIAP